MSVVVSNTNRENCLFRQFERDPENMPESMADVFGVLASMETEPEVPGDVAEAINAMETPICPVEGCRVSASGLLRYVTSAGDDAPRQELDEAAIPSCAILDVPHAADEILGPYEWPDDPRT